MNEWFDWRLPRGGVAFIAGGFIVGSIYFMIRGGDSWYTHYVCPFFLPVGIGLWLKHGWARWVTFAFFSVLAIGYVLALFRDGASVRQLARGAVIAGSLFSLWEWKVYPAPPKTESKA